MIEKAKVIVAFDRAFEDLVYNGEIFAVEPICSMMRRTKKNLANQMNDVLTAWRHSEMNGICTFLIWRFTNTGTYASFCCLCK